MQPLAHSAACPPAPYPPTACPSAAALAPGQSAVVAVPAWSSQAQVMAAALGQAGARAEGKW